MTCADLNPFPEASAFRRTPAEVMRLSRLGCAHPTRLSFLRILLRRFRDEGWTFDRPVFDIDEKGVGRAVYRVAGPARTYSLVCFSHDLPDDMRSDRVIATAWDATFALFDGMPDEADLDRLQANVPYQEAGRISGRELTLARANRSVRLFEHAVERLAAGAQPDAAQLAETGYLMRTTAVYGSGKFGAADRQAIAGRAEMTGPFQAEMLTVWLIRSFTVDLVDHLAFLRGGSAAARLDAASRSLIGVGNSTGLGMAPFLVHHPNLLNNWVMVREEALARVRSRAVADAQTVAQFTAALENAAENARHWRSDHPIQIAKLRDLAAGLDKIADHVSGPWQPFGDHPWDRLWHWGSRNLTTEAQEALLSLLLEPHGDIIDDLAECLSDNAETGHFVNGAMTIGQLDGLITQNYGWALEPDYSDNDACARFWYVSEDKLEPRLGERHEEPGAESELPLDIGRQVSRLKRAIDGRDAGEPVAALVLQEPRHRLAVARVQQCASRPFSEIRDNLVSSDLLPIDMLRCKLAFFGATRFDPRSDRWVRISLFQGLPYPGDIHAGLKL